jgi:nucleotide-binding universal stress UspA family protein
MISRRRILTPIDGSPVAVRAENMAISLAKSTRGKIFFVYVIPTDIDEMHVFEEYTVFEVKNWEMNTEEDVEKVKTLLQNALSKSKKAKVKASAKLFRTTKSIREAICKIAEDMNVGLIVIGTRGTSIKKVILGSVAQGVVTHAECPVLIVK